VEIKVVFKLKCCKKFRIILILLQSISAHSGKNPSSSLLFSRARNGEVIPNTSRADGIADEVRDPEKSLEIEENRRAILCYRCFVQVHRYARGDEGSREREMVSQLPHGGRKHSYTSSDRIRNDTEVEEVETEMAPTWFRTRSNIGRRLQVWAIFREVVIYLRTAASSDRLSLLGQPFASRARKLTSVWTWRDNFQIDRTNRSNQSSLRMIVLLASRENSCANVVKFINVISFTLRSSLNLNV